MSMKTQLEKKDVRLLMFPCSYGFVLINSFTHLFNDQFLNTHYMDSSICLGYISEQDKDPCSPRN